MGIKTQNTFTGCKPADTGPSIKSVTSARQNVPSRARLVLSAEQEAIADDRQRLLCSALPLLEAHLPQFAVAKMLGVSPATFSRLLNQCPVKGNFARSALAKCRRLVKLPVARLAPKAASGPESWFAPLLDVPPIIKELKQLYAGNRLAGRAPAICISAALQDLGYCPAVPPLLAHKLRVGSHPKPLVDFLKNL